MSPSRSRRCAATALLSVSALIALHQPAAALDFFALFDREPARSAAPAAPTHIQETTRAKPKKVARPEAPRPARTAVEGERKPVTDTKPGLPLFGVVSIADQHISIYNNNGLVTRSPVSTGMEGHSTPKGIFTIIGRERYHKSNIYSGAPMPFMQRITWSGIAMHVGVVPGHPASHGCIRLPADFAAKLWGMTRIGERVIISPQEIWPEPFSNDLLPKAKLYVVAGPGAETLVYGPTESGAEDAPAAPLNPRQYAERLKARAAAEALAASKALKAAAAAEKTAQDEFAAASRELGAMESDRSTAQMKADAADEAYLAATARAHALQEEASLASVSMSMEEETRRRTRFVSALDAAATARINAATAKIAFSRALTEVTTKLDAARSSLAVKEARLSEASARLSEATAVAAAATKGDAELRRRLSPISVLVSKKDQRVYVRQGLVPLFDAPVVVKDADRPLGSHLFIATAEDNDPIGLKWTVLSVPGSPSSAEEALERIEMSPEIRARIGERLWTGGSMIVSDQPPSGETGADGTDLTVKIR
jgi:lipoprotein-anchoring transpeptidase ErfK/SrfK